MKVLLKDIDSHYYKTESVRHEAVAFLGQQTLVELHAK